MPRYDYICQRCDAVFETRLSFAEVDTAQPACPECGSVDCQRAIGRVNFVVGNGSSGDVIPLRSSSRRCSTCGGGNCSTCF